jgi:NAD(P)-dependent dehydrogenase (short-subunit alcohol dehydrogenase family)
MANILITGTSKGIGYETALAFARAGHHVFATMRTPANAPKLAEVTQAENLPITISAMDVDSDESVHEAIAPILANGPIDVLINNAGLESVGSIEEQPLSQFRATMETNYFGAVRCIKAVVPSMRQRASGCIVNISSVAGRVAAPPFSGYSASKWALEALSEALAGEMKAFNVRVAVIEPGIIDTEMARRVGTPGTESTYRHAARFATLFSNSLQQPIPPTLVAEKILDVYTSGTWQFRHLVGPTADGFIAWRNSFTDEQWIDTNAADDATFFASLGG